MALNRIFSTCLIDVSFEMTKETILLFSLRQHREKLCQATKYSVPLEQYFLLTRGNRSRCRPCFHWWSLMLESVGYRCGPCTLFWAPPFIEHNQFFFWCCRRCRRRALMATLHQPQRKHPEKMEPLTSVKKTLILFRCWTNRDNWVADHRRETFCLADTHRQM